MATRFVTVHRQDPQFDALISGDFSQQERAIPVSSLNIRSQSQFVTFKVIPSENHNRPSRAYVIWKGLRPRILTITVAPPLLSLIVLARLQQSIDWSMVALSFAALVFFHFSVFLLNDYFDHYKGRDQIHRQKGSRIIQKGWASGKSIRFWGFFNLALGVAFGFPAVISNPLLVGSIGFFAFLVVVGFSSRKMGLRDTGLGEIIISISLGPLLVSGFCLTVSNTLPIDAAMVGIVFGWMASLIFQLKNLEEMVATYQNRSRTLIQKLGFDGGKSFIRWQLILLPFVALALFQFVEMRLVLSVCTLPLFVTGFLLARKIKRANSPMSSWLTGVSDQMALSHLKNAIYFSILLFPPIV